MKDYWEEPVQKKINKKKITTTIIIGVVVMVLLSIIIIYHVNKLFREWIDKNIFRKEVLQDKVSTIELKEDQNSNITAFNKYIGVLNVYVSMM